MEIEHLEPGMMGFFQPPILPTVYSQPGTVGDKLDVASSFTRDAALDFDAYNAAALHQLPFQPAHEAFNQCSLINGCSINTSSQAQWNDQILQSVPAYEIEHVPSASKIAQSPFRPLRPKPTQQQTQMPRLAASKKPLHCTKCSKTYNSPGGLRRHDVKGHNAERRTGGRPSTSSRRLSWIIVKNK
ncbi:Zinc finger, C2H2 [Penicillium roqueforti FM164]|uniref:Zinc finger, C2H2 n=1 Tax=Penicillium roqueforti (strain FM164) TaxID=1365484 RepID=W6QID0_PENRF|nr:Zinc finger, C2H2 [Penicillium roqueforti FM164]